ncbi:MAG TPA: hypothetical protein VGG25_00170 [Streptosporangiaceae bacterium]
MAAQAATHPATPPLTKVHNLIKDSGAEQAKGTQSGDKVKVPDWTPAKGSQFTAVPYGAPDFLLKNSPGPKDRGKNFFAGGPSGNTSGAHQRISLSSLRTLIKSGKASFTLSGWFGGWYNQRDYAELTVVFFNSTGRKLAQATVGPVTARQRHDAIKLLFRHKTGKVPAAATTAVVYLRMVRKDGSYLDGYADNLKLVIIKRH